uniref:Putative 6-pyruvoyl tetrahydrobiopterin synthase n=1 Tax=Caenorhabditis elegans TaxID=6239 RepID=UPI00006CA34A|nr:Chain A, Putative 6-pyruvoyl tetrahydrobiopterin synthase [Caenorhabditis elegans]
MFRMPIVTMERVDSFSAAHRLHSEKLSDAENKETFGKCNNSNGHGHNYVWKVKLRGEVDPTSGMVYDLAKLKKEMSLVLDTVDHRNLDKDVEFFKTTVSTSENVAIYMFEKLKSVMSNPSVLYKVTIEETPKNIFTYKGS